MNDLPSETWHGFKYIDFGPDGNLYIPVGVPCNICIEPQMKDSRFAAIHKYQNGKLVTVADGVRNSVGFDWHPITKKILPVYIANFILMDYGLGAVFGCPAHDQRDLDFANKYNLTVKPVVTPNKDDLNFKVKDEAYTGPGFIFNSSFLGKPSTCSLAIALIKVVLPQLLGPNKP